MTIAAEAKNGAVSDPKFRVAARKANAPIEAQSATCSANSHWAASATGAPTSAWKARFSCVELIRVRSIT